MAKGTLRGLAAIGISILAAIATPVPAYCDPFAGTNFSSIGSLLIMLAVLEPLVIVYEGRYMSGALGLPPRTASIWSLIANLISLVLGSAVLWAVVVVETFGGHPLAMLVVVALSILVAFIFEYPSLCLLNRKRLAKGNLAKCCLKMNVVSVPSMYAAQYLLFLVFAWMSQPVL